MSEITGTVLGQSYPIVLPSAAPGKDGTSITGPKGDKGDTGDTGPKGDTGTGVAGNNGTDGVNGITVNINTCDNTSPFDFTGIGNHALVTRTIPANTFTALDIMEVESLIRVPSTTTNITLYVTFGGTEIFNTTVVADETGGITDGFIPPIPSDYAYIKFGFKMFMKTSSTQFCTKEYELIGATTTKLSLVPTTTAFNMATDKELVVGITLGSVGSVRNYYTTVVQYKG